MICPHCGQEALTLYYTHKGFPITSSTLDGCDKCIQIKATVKQDNTCSACRGDVVTKLADLENRGIEIERAIEHMVMVKNKEIKI